MVRFSQRLKPYKSPTLLIQFAGTTNRYPSTNFPKKNVEHAYKHPLKKSNIFLQKKSTFLSSSKLKYFSHILSTYNNQLTVK